MTSDAMIDRIAAAILAINGPDDSERIASVLITKVKEAHAATGRKTGKADRRGTPARRLDDKRKKALPGASRCNNLGDADPRVWRPCSRAFGHEGPCAHHSACGCQNGCKAPNCPHL